MALLVWGSLCGWAQGVADVHSHNVLALYTDFLDSHDALLEEGFPIPAWSVEAHLRTMDEAGIAWSVLSMPAPQPYFGDVAESRRVIRAYNEATAAVSRRYPDRFKFCASLPLPDVDAAIEEAVYALDTLHADGVKLATNSRGQYLGDAALDPLMAVLDERHAVVILHPHKPSPFADSLMRLVPLAAYEYPAETTRAVVAMLSRNVPARYPNIRFVVPHGGSFLPLAIPRMKRILEVMRQAGMAMEVDWEGNLQNLYYDLAGGVSPEVLRLLLSVAPPSHLLFGSDYPYVGQAGVSAAVGALRTVLASNPDCASMVEGIMKDNASRLFGE